MSKKKRKRRTIITLFLILIILCVVFYFLLFKLKSKDSHIISKIEDYGYTLEKRDTQIMQDVFNKLSETLENDKIDYEKYAEYISELFIIDLYTLNNKSSKYDVGGSEYVYPSHRDNYILKVQDTLYKYLEEKSGRKQKLPVVEDINVTNIERGETYNVNEKEYETYNVDISWSYSADLGYDTEGSIILIQEGNKLYIAEYTPEVSE